jgi:uncharacterized integral membrane protein
VGFSPEFLGYDIVMNDRSDQPVTGAPIPPVDADAAATPPDELEVSQPAPPDRVVERVPTGTGLRWGLILGIILSIPLIVFLAQNTQSVTINFLTWTGQIPLVAVLGATVILTIVIDELIGLAVRSRRRKSIVEHQELQRLRSAPPR